MKGVYVLIIRIKTPIRTNVGVLGELEFPKGLYAYVGSAQNNLELRVKRHERKDKPLFWHIDYLLKEEAAKITTVYYKLGRKTEECKIASLIGSNAQSIAGFGSSDCHCSSHLFKAQNFDFLKKIMQKLKPQDENA